jgi:hypothetical protein
VLLFLGGALAVGEPPDFGASGEVIAAHAAEHRDGIRVGVALDAAATPLLLWFLATIAGLAGEAGPGPRRAGLTALGCGIAFVAVFLADVASLAVRALHPGNVSRAPELARALHDFEWLAIGLATPLAVGMLAALATLPLRYGALWPRWLGWLAVAAAAAYAFRLGTVFTDQGAFAADGPLGLYLPVAALAGWLLIASLVLTRGRYD